jgi:prepilin-type N-terminal cleavage/methylation domain-containing protein
MRRVQSGFTLTELAVVMTIVAILLASAMYTLSAQTEQRDFQETQRRLNEARDLVLAFAMINGRLPCPARNAATAAPATTPGGEVWEVATGECRGDGVTDNLGGTISVGPVVVGGFLSGRAIGFQPVDGFGFALDSWGNRLRYAVSRVAGNPPGGAGCVGPAAPGFTSAPNLKANGMVCAPQNIVICTTAAGSNGGVTPPTCAAGAMVTNQSTIAAVIYSTGKNSNIACGTCLDEAENVDGDGVFVWHDPRPTGALGGEYDDMMVWIPAGVLYAKLIAAGVLP